MSVLRFATIADADHAVGVIALVNSLRLLGYLERVTVLDLGLTPTQRRLLAPECDLKPRPAVPSHPWLLVPAACRAASEDAGPDDVVVYVDCDVIVTAPLDEVLAHARAGRVVAYVDQFTPDRRFPEWADRLGLAGPLRLQPYANAGFVVFVPARHGGFLDRWEQRCAALDGTPIDLRDTTFAGPWALPDQDVLNAMLMTELPPEAVALLPSARMAQGRDDLILTRVVDPARLRCERDGSGMDMLHSVGRPKPWQPGAATDLHRSAYLTLLRRLLVDPDLALAAPDDVEPWLRPGRAGALALRRLTLSDRLRTATRGVRRRVGLVRRSSAPRPPSP
ncbi:MAG: hypothetical protein U0W40_16025 [Acidimicrobiia bacterium]